MRDDKTLGVVKRITVGIVNLWVIRNAMKHIKVQPILYTVQK